MKEQQRIGKKLWTRIKNSHQRGRKYKKFLMSLQPNCEDARINATSVTEKTVPATPIIAPEMVDKILRAESALFTKKNRVSIFWGRLTKLSKYTKPTDRRIEKMIIRT